MGQNEGVDWELVNLRFWSFMAMCILVAQSVQDISSFRCCWTTTSQMYRNSISLQDLPGFLGFFVTEAIVDIMGDGCRLDEG